MMRASASSLAARQSSTGVPVASPDTIRDQTHRRASVRAFAAQAGPVVQPGPPPPVALVSFTRKGAAKPSDPTDPDAHEVGIVEGGQWLWPVPRSK